MMLRGLAAKMSLHENNDCCLRQNRKEETLEITQKTTLGELYDYEPLRKAARYLVGCSDPNFYRSIAGDSFERMHEAVPPWNSSDMVFGVQRLVALAERGIPYFHAVYSEPEIAHDPRKDDVKLFYFPAEYEKKKTNHYILLCSGGAFHNVCNVQEAFPVAARLNELGITAFCLDYRTWSKEYAQSGVAQLTMEDVSAALSYIDAHADEFGVEAGKYAMGGFSAGGFVAGSWGTETNGYRAYGKEKPELLMLDYAFLSTDSLQELPQEDQENIKCLVGETVTREKLHQVSVIEHVNSDYPAVALVQCEDDSAMPFSNWVRMKKTLEENGVPHIVRSGKKGGHGYGLGTGTDVAGWVEEAAAFWMAGLAAENAEEDSVK